MSELIAVDGDLDSNGSGPLDSTTGDSATKTVFINGKAVIAGVTDSTDNSNSTEEDSSTVFIYGKGVHRNKDKRSDGSSTVVSGQDSVFAG